MFPGILAFLFGQVVDVIGKWVFVVPAASVATVKASVSIVGETKGENINGF